MFCNSVIALCALYSGLCGAGLWFLRDRLRDSERAITRLEKWRDSSPSDLGEKPNEIDFRLMTVEAEYEAGRLTSLEEHIDDLAVRLEDVERFLNPIPRDLADRLKGITDRFEEIDLLLNISAGAIYQLKARASASSSDERESQ